MVVVDLCVNELLLRIAWAVSCSKCPTGNHKNTREKLMFVLQLLLLKECITPQYKTIKAMTTLQTFRNY